MHWKLCSHKNLHRNVYRRFIRKCQNWKEPRCLSVGEWINKLWCSHAIEYYSVITRNEVSSHEKKNGRNKHSVTWKKPIWGNFLVVQWLRLRASIAGSPGSIPGRGSNPASHAAQPKTTKQNRRSQSEKAIYCIIPPAVKSPTYEQVPFREHVVSPVCS